MPEIEPTTAISAISTIAGLAQTLMNTEKASPEYLDALQWIRKFADEGYGKEYISKLQEKLKRSVGEEFAGLSAATQQRLALGGASPATIQAAMNRLQGKRQEAIGKAVETAQLKNEEAKLKAMQALLEASSQLPYSTGQGGAQLFSTGLLGLLMKLGAGGNQGGLIQTADELPKGKTVTNDYVGLG